MEHSSSLRFFPHCICCALVSYSMGGSLDAAKKVNGCSFVCFACANGTNLWIFCGMVQTVKIGYDFFCNKKNIFSYAWLWVNC